MSLMQDVRFAVRVLAKNRWFTLMAAIVLTLGIGANNGRYGSLTTRHRGASRHG